MILTGHQIQQSVKNGTIDLSPFNLSNLNPNSYNFRLDSKIKKFSHTNNNKHNFIEEEISDKGYILEPGTMYLANTKEVIGSNKFAMSLIGRSSVARLGLFIQVCADLGHTTSSHKWTLEMVSTRRIKVYDGMIIGQVSFWVNKGVFSPYQGKYAKINHPQESLIKLNN